MTLKPVNSIVNSFDYRLFTTIVKSAVHCPFNPAVLETVVLKYMGMREKHDLVWFLKFAQVFVVMKYFNW